MTNPTIKDIASICGVSVSTVSRAINDAEGISAKTRAKILKTIKETGYEPDTNARNLKITKNKTIAVLIKGITNPLLYSDDQGYRRRNKQNQPFFHPK